MSMKYEYAILLFSRQYDFQHFKELRGFNFELCTNAQDLLRLIKKGRFRAVICEYNQDITNDELKAVQEACDAFVLPFILVSDPELENIQELLGVGKYAGYMDINWPAHLQEAMLISIFRTFQDGQNLVAIQKQVLNAIQGEVLDLQDLIYRDDLTRLHNLRYFNQIIEREHARCIRHQRSYALVYLDLDGLKQINTMYGHAAGAHTLREVGDIIAALTRNCDYAFRIGGDEFVSIIVETDKWGAYVYAQRLVQQIAQLRIHIGDDDIGVTASCGVASFPLDAESHEMVLQRADRAMFEAKYRGKNQVFCFEQET